MRILLTNDDGISARGLEVAEAIAHDLVGPEGEVWVVAPAFEQSGVSHSVSYVRPMRIERIEERRFAVEGSPADCVLAGLRDIVKGGPVDLVLSGVNRGHNVAEDTLYSGTVGGALEGALHGVRSVAMSQYHGPAAEGDGFAAARAHGTALLRRLVEAAGWPASPYAVFYNVNFPPVPAAERARHQGDLPGPPGGADLRGAAAGGAERAELPLADPRPRQRRHRARLGFAGMP